MYRTKPKGQTHELLTITEEVKEKQQKSLSATAGVPGIRDVPKSCSWPFPTTTRMWCLKTPTHQKGQKYSLWAPNPAAQGICAPFPAVPWLSCCAFSPSEPSVLPQCLLQPEMAGMRHSWHREVKDPEEPSKMDTQQNNDLWHRVGFWARNSTLSYEIREVSCQQPLLTVSFCIPSCGHRGPASTRTALERPGCESKSGTWWYICKQISVHNPTCKPLLPVLCPPHSLCEILTKIKQVSGWKRYCGQE